MHGSITWTTGTGRSYVTTPFDHRDPTPTRDENWRALRSFLASRQMEHADLDDDPHPDDDWDGDDHDGGRGHDGRGHDGGGGGGVAGTAVAWAAVVAAPAGASAAPSTLDPASLRTR